MTRQALKVASDGTVTELDLDAAEGSLRVMQAGVDGYIERVMLDGFDMYVNADGKLKDLPFNSVGTLFYHDVYGPGDVIMGDVVFTGEVDAEGESTTGLTQGAVQRIRDAASISHLM